MNTDETVEVPDNSRHSETDRGSDVPVTELFHWIYRLFYSKTVGLVLILATAVLVLVGVVIGQAPEGAYDTSESRAAFLAQATGKYGFWAKAFDFLGFFRVFSSPVFLTVIGLLTLSIVACTTHRIPLLWNRYRHPRTHVSARFFTTARYRASVGTDLETSRALEVVGEQLRRRRYRVIPDKDDVTRIYADKFAWGGFGTVVAHASFIIILAAFVISGQFGVSDNLVVPIGGKPAPVGHGTNLEVAATSFKAPVDATGRPLDYVSHLVLREGGRVVAEQDVRVNDPLSYQGFRFHQASFGHAVDLLVKTPSGQSLFDGSVALQQAAESGNDVGLVELSAKDLELRILIPSSGTQGSRLSPGQASIGVFKKGADDPEDVITAEQGSPVDVGGLQVTFQREREYTGVLLRQDPGAIWMWIGSILLVLGMTVTFSFQYRRIWVRVDESRPRSVQLASADKEDYRFKQKFDELETEIADALVNEGSKGKEYRA